MPSLRAVVSCQAYVHEMDGTAPKEACGGVFDPTCFLETLDILATSMPERSSKPHLLAASLERPGFKPCCMLPAHPANGYSWNSMRPYNGSISADWRAVLTYHHEPRVVAIIPSIAAAAAAA